VSVGVGIEQVAEALKKALPDLSLLVVDSDHIKKTQEIFQALPTTDIILATHMGALLSHADIGAVIFLLFEVNLSIPEYDLEEELYTRMIYIKKQNIPLYIQTHMMEHPILQEIVFGNYRSFLQMLSQERRAFSYPPYSDFVTLHVHHAKKPMVRSIVQELIEKIEPLLSEGVFFAYDRDIFTRSRSQYVQKIILKGRGVADILEALQSDILRHYAITLEWH